MMRAVRSAAARAIALSLTFALAASAPPALAAGGAAPPRDRIRVASMPFIGFAVFTIAQQEGFFDAQGLDVEFVALDRTYKGIPSLSAGELDVHAGTPNAAIFNAIAQGADVRFVAGKDYVPASGCSVDALVVRRELAPAGDAPFDLARLRGKRIAVYSAAFDEYLLDRILARGGLSLKDVERQTIPYPALPDALRNGGVDAAVASEPWLTRILGEGIAVKVVSAGEVLPGAERSDIFFGPSLLRERVAVGERFLAAYLRAVRQYAEGKTERNVGLLAAHTGMPGDFVRSICWPSLRADGVPDVASLADFQAWAVRAGYLDGTVAPDRFWDGRFAERAGAALGSAR